MDIIKNPIIIGLVIGALTYGYLSYTVNEKNEENDKKKKHKRKEKESVNLMIPLVVAIIVWFIAYAYFEYNIDNKPNNSQILPTIGESLPMPLPVSPKFGFIKDVISDTSDPQLFSLINTGMTVPINLPDVLLDIH